jgi:hypothetical protein
MSILRLKTADILGGLSIKDSFLSSKIKNISNNLHFLNTVNYIKRMSKVIMEDVEVLFEPTLHSVFSILDAAEEPKRFSDNDMLEFRKRFPLKNMWKKTCAQKRMSKKTIDVLQEMEDQRVFEDNKRPLTDEEINELIPNSPLIEIARDLRSQLINHDKNSGVCLILCGSAMTCKSTLNRIIAESFGEYNIWPGSQWIQKVLHFFYILNY